MDSQIGSALGASQRAFAPSQPKAPEPRMRSLGVKTSAEVQLREAGASLQAVARDSQRRPLAGSFENSLPSVKNRVHRQTL